MFQIHRILISVFLAQSVSAANGLPSQFSFGGNLYTQQPDPVQDLGRFTTMGLRVKGPNSGQDHVVFWESTKPGAAKLPDPLPKTLYLLNAARNFVAYSF